MSLHNLAQHLQGAGRRGDSVLVHMSPDEVKGLQALAMAHGGSLTINPKTGLPEAFFLAAILPTIAGIGLQAAGMTAMQAALTTAAVGTLATGNLGKGLMMGLGAYGGAGLGDALATAGGAAALGGAGAGTTAADIFSASPIAVPTPGANVFSARPASVGSKELRKPASGSPVCGLIVRLPPCAIARDCKPCTSLGVM